VLKIDRLPNVESAMTIRKILAPMTGGERDRIVLASAFAAARPFDAHIVALFVRPDPAEAMPFFGEGTSAVVVEEIVNVARDAADRAAAAVHASIHAVAAAQGATILQSPERASGSSVSFRDVQGNFTDCVTRAARLADLVVLGPLSEGDRPGLTEAFEATLVETGRPVLLSAKAQPQDFGKKIALAWDGSLPCAHAVSSALPYLSRATEIEALSVQRGAADTHALAELHEYLGLHGLTCSDRTLDASSKPIGQVLLESASAGGAGLLVIGGYGHSRLREFFAGGVTRHVVSHATIPVFMVH
jgi:nucleotide-binding universal stress UspA family protein